MALTENDEHLQCGKDLGIFARHRHTTLSGFREIFPPIFPKNKIFNNNPEKNILKIRHYYTRVDLLHRM